MSVNGPNNNKPVNTGAANNTKKPSAMDEANNFMDQNKRYWEGVNAETQKVKNDVASSLYEFADVLDYDRNWFSANDVVLKSTKNMTLGEIKERFHIPSGVLKSANSWMENYEGNLDDCVPRGKITIPSDKIGNFDEKETLKMYNEAVGKYAGNKNKAVNFLTTNKTNITYDENKKDSKGPFILVKGNDKLTLADYKDQFSLKDGVIKRNNDYHAPDLDAYKPKQTEYVKIYVNEIAGIGVPDKQVRNALGK